MPQSGNNLNMKCTPARSSRREEAQMPVTLWLGGFGAGEKAKDTKIL
jgi:hypothetical protein